MLIKRHLEYSLLGNDPNLRIDRFPDGQQNVTILNLEDLKNADSVNLVSRMNNFKDLELILCFKACLKKLKSSSCPVVLTVPYLLGSRSDRVFGPGSNCYSEMLLGILDHAGFDEVETLDLHNPEIRHYFEAELSNVTVDSPVIKDSVLSILKPTEYEHFILQAPDAGAVLRASQLFEALKGNLSCELFRPLAKRRTPEGVEITGLSHGSLTGEVNALVLIVDDICDGGATFVEVAKAYKEKYPKLDLGLYVTHGIFSKGFEELQKYYKFVITTNSYQDFGEGYFNSVKNKSLKGFLHQINIF